MVLHFAGQAIDVPNGTIVGVVGEDATRIAELIDGVPEAQVRRFPYALDLLDAYTRLDLHSRMEQLRRAGEVGLVASHNEELLRLHADELWWVHEDRIALRGGAPEVLGAYMRHVVERFRSSVPNERLCPKFRRGDGRAELLALDLLTDDGRRTSILSSGEGASARIVVRYRAAVEDPVIGMMIRTRIGMEVYGTNTELEGIQVGPCQAGDIRTVQFRFRCDLCPGRYTLTAASHDPNGVWHDWMEDASAFTVSSERYTAGVANLRASVTVINGFPE
jgi:lipopolysaccharide transport system ATP-binding protein